MPGDSRLHNIFHKFPEFARQNSECVGQTQKKSILRNHHDSLLSFNLIMCALILKAIELYNNSK